MKSNKSVNDSIEVSQKSQKEPIKESVNFSMFESMQKSEMEGSQSITDKKQATAN